MAGPPRRLVYVGQNGERWYRVDPKETFTRTDVYPLSAVVSCKGCVRCVRGPIHTSDGRTY